MANLTKAPQKTAIGIFHQRHKTHFLGVSASSEEFYNCIKCELLKVLLFVGTAGDSLSFHKSRAFTTKDSDNDGWRKGNCAIDSKGAWWYSGCHDSNLNGYYFKGNKRNVKGVLWGRWKGGISLKFTEMKIKP